MYNTEHNMVVAYVQRRTRQKVLFDLRNFYEWQHLTNKSSICLQKNQQLEKELFVHPFPRIFLLNTTFKIIFTVSPLDAQHEKSSVEKKSLVR